MAKTYYMVKSTDGKYLHSTRLIFTDINTGSMFLSEEAAEAFRRELPTYQHSRTKVITVSYNPDGGQLTEITST